MPENKANTPAGNAAGISKRATRSSNPITNNPPNSAQTRGKGTPKKKSTASRAGTKRKPSTSELRVEEHHQLSLQLSPPKKKPKTPADMMSNWFDDLVSADEPDKDTMTSISLIPFLTSLNIDPDGAAFLVMVYKFQGDNDQMPVMFEMKRSEFIRGTVANNITNSHELLKALGHWLEELRPNPNSESFIRFFKWCFRHLKGEGFVKAIGLDTATLFIEVLCDPARYALIDAPNTQPERLGTGPFPHRVAFCNFLRELKPVKSINRDQWESFIAFNSAITWSMEGYDLMESSWPCLYDEYVQYHEKKYPGVKANGENKPGQNAGFDEDDLWREL